MITLALDASTYRGTVAVLAGSEVVGEGDAPMRGRDAEHLMPCVDATLRSAGIELRAVDRVVCGAGPGSFTSLRIAASIAKGLTMGLAIPLYAVSSLGLIVAGNVAGASTSATGPAMAKGVHSYIAALDALRDECYVARFAHERGGVRQLDAPRLIGKSDLQRFGAELGAMVVGPDEPGHWQPHARGATLMQDAITRAGPVDLASWEPVYGRIAEAQLKWEAAHGRALPG